VSPPLAPSACAPAAKRAGARRPRDPSAPTPSRSPPPISWTPSRSSWTARRPLTECVRLKNRRDDEGARPPMSDERILAILVSGGPAPGINAVISAATIEARNHGLRVVGCYAAFPCLPPAHPD